MQQAVKNNYGRNFSLTDLSEDLQNYWQRYTAPGFDRTPDYMKEWKDRYQLFKKIFLKINLGLKSFLDLSIFGKVRDFIKKSLGENIKKEYYELQQEPDFKKKYVYLPLHFQPERTTCPQGDMYNDQILMAETIAAALPKDWLLYIKEHPVQWLPTGLNYSDVRFKGYYRRLARLPKVCLVSVSTSTFDLTKNAQAVVAIAGTAGWEAIMHFKPVLSFGYPWYADFPFVYQIDGAQTCRQVLAKIDQGAAGFGEQAVINYLKNFEQATLRDAYFLAGRKADSILNEAESLNNIVETIDRQLKNQLQPA